MTDTLAWLFLSWLLPAAGCMISLFVIIGCAWLTVYMLAEILNRIRMVFEK